MSLISNHPRSPIGRRRVVKAVLAGAGAILAARALAATRDDGAREQSAAHFPFGPVLPLRALPALPLLTDLGQAADLATLLHRTPDGRAADVHRLQCHLPHRKRSFRTSAAGAAPPLAAVPTDGSMVVAQHRPLVGRPGATRRLAAKVRRAPGMGRGGTARRQRGALFAVLGRSGEPRPRASDPHTGQLYILNRRGELAFRTASPPAPTTIFEALRGIDAERPGG